MSQVVNVWQTATPWTPWLVFEFNFSFQVCLKAHEIKNLKKIVQNVYPVATIKLL